MRGRALALTFSIFVQGMNVIIRLMMFLTNGFTTTGSANVAFIVTCLAGLGALHLAAHAPGPPGRAHPDDPLDPLDTQKNPALARDFLYSYFYGSSWIQNCAHLDGGLRRADDALVLHRIDQARGARVPDAQLALQHRDGRLALLAHQFDRLIDDRVALLAAQFLVEQRRLRAAACSSGRSMLTGSAVLVGAAC